MGYCKLFSPKSELGVVVVGFRVTPPNMLNLPAISAIVPSVVLDMATLLTAGFLRWHITVANFRRSIPSRKARNNSRGTAPSAGFVGKHEC